MHSRRESLQQHGGAENVVVLVRLHNVRGRAALRPAIARDVPVDVEQLESLPALSVPSNSFQQSHRRSTCLPMTFASSVVTASTTPSSPRSNIAIICSSARPTTSTLEDVGPCGCFAYFVR